MSRAKGREFESQCGEKLFVESLQVNYERGWKRVGRFNERCFQDKMQEKNDNGQIDYAMISIRVNACCVSFREKQVFWTVW